MEQTPTQIDFAQYHQPALENGEYRVTVSQTLNINGNETQLGGRSRSVAEFFVAGERFRINPSEIGTVFPPNNSLGDHGNVLPHILLTRDTLPWERKAIPEDPDTPWMGLLVVHEEEQNLVRTDVVALGELIPAATGPQYFPGLGGLEPGQQATDRVQVLDIQRGLLESILPDRQSLRYLSHTRQGRDGEGRPVGQDRAALVANRLSERGAANTVYLVSLETRYGTDGLFGYQGAGEADAIRMVLLYSWQFTSTERFAVTASFLAGVSNLPESILVRMQVLTGREFFTRSSFAEALANEAGLTAQELANNQAIIFREFAFGDFAGILKHLNQDAPSLRLPDVGNAETDSFLQMGFYPLPHELRQGEQTVSWYHGPLSPRSNTETANFPIAAADTLLRYYDVNGMFDVSYASAWELGRLLALQNTQFSTTLYQWKRQYAKCLNQKQQLIDQSTGHLQGAAGRIHYPQSLKV